MLGTQPGMETWLNEVKAVLIKGKLHRDKLQYAFQSVIDQYEILRTSFELAPKPLQIVSKDFQVPFYTETLSHLSTPVKKDRIAAILKAEREWVFDLQKLPLIHLRLIELASNEHLLILNNNHIISDGWSMGVLIQKVIYAYNQLVHGKKIDLPSISIQYSDYSRWSTQLLGTQKVQNMGVYWLKKLGGKLAQLQLPTDYERTNSLGIEGGTQKTILDAHCIKFLQRFQKENNLTLFQSFLVIVKSLFFRISGQTEIVLGTHIALRNHPQLDDQIGIMLNYLVLRNYLDPSKSLGEFASTVQKSLLEGIENGLYPFPLLTQSVEQDEEQGRHPLFSVLILEKINENTITGMDGVEIEWYSNMPPKSRYDLVFLIQEEDGKIEIDIDYKKSLFKASTIKAMIYWIHKFLKHLPYSKDSILAESLPLWTHIKDSE